MSEAMELTERNFEQIGSYVREHLGTWIRDISPATTTVQLDPAYLERIVRVEEELKTQRELMKRGFDQVDKRFEQIERRFEQTDRHMNRWMTAIVIVIALVGTAGTLVATLA